MGELPVETGSMLTRDGVRLDADIYRPEGDGPWPVLLLRQAYGRRVAATVSYAHPRWYAAQGYVVVVQDVRGRGTSKGFFETLEHEAEDGADAIAWCSALPGTTGEVGMYGFSYQGMNQLLAASCAGPALKAIAPAMIGWDLRNEMVCEGGVPQLAGAIAWAAQVGADTARHQGDRQAYEELRQAANNLPLSGPVAARPEVMTRWARYHHYYRWLEAGDGHALWQRIAPCHRLDALADRHLPMLFIGGWYDFTLPGTLAGWAAMRERQPECTRLVVGPWAHLPWGRIVGGTDFGEAAVSDIDLLQIAWFDHWLKGKPLAGAPIRLFDLGLCRWTESSALPTDTRSLYLGGNGRASVDPAAGWLGEEAETSGEDLFVHDPWRPAPTCGGRLGGPPGPLDRREIDQRGDVLTFTTPPLKQPLALSVPLKAVIHAEADTGSFDLHCTVSHITPDGAVRGFAEGACRIAGASGIVAAEVDLKAVCITLMPGDSLRLSIAGASYPAFALNPGEGGPIDTPHMDARITTIAVHHGRDHPSALVMGTGPTDMLEAP